jgi:hypothetical protein
MSGGQRAGEAAAIPRDRGTRDEDVRDRCARQSPRADGQYEQQEREHQPAGITGEAADEIHVVDDDRMMHDELSTDVRGYPSSSSRRHRGQTIAAQARRTRL